MTEQADRLLAINSRQQDTADADLLALLLEDATSRVVASPDRTTITDYVDAAGGKHSIQTLNP